MRSTSGSNMDPILDFEKQEILNLYQLNMENMMIEGRACVALMCM